MRRATLEDLEALARGVRSVADEGRWLATPAGTPVEGSRQRFRWTIAGDEARLLVLEEQDEVVGALGLRT